MKVFRLIALASVASALAFGCAEKPGKPKKDDKKADKDKKNKKNKKGDKKK